MISKFPVLVAQITDTHLFANPTQGKMYGVPTETSFLKVLEKLGQLQPQPDVLLLTGDISQDETPESYQRLASLLSALNIPTYWIAGNHDCLPIMEQVLNSAPISSQKSFEIGGWYFLLLNTNVPGCVYGQVSPESLKWLESQLKIIGNKPVLIALHHPLVKINSEWMDRILLHEPEPLLNIINRYPQVKIVLSGHVHQEFDTEINGIRYLTTPSTCIQFEPKNPEFVLDKKSPGLRLLSLYPDGNYTTKIERADYIYEFDITASGY
ncbi:3',5'-cyclic-nucleotide phosphodiesterase [Hydrocoleum sp. CS-953]|uniref:3',5'-cyclic-AMP phosphodiesterase n=1 Tax=Hydrocoleum sp. CS-953 TaxID=1671698 RepID=UPI000B9BCF87|nr:3',5'-cyclic-AMP phosphodiesterase [Hydrocoleum sp. CS-953]OZH51687.1 3',5'-cyclic-nucleotide phosphodiesterase [Hydrocoleum sp. CS-953]